VQIDHLILTKYRNYDFERLDFAPKFNAFIGKNGMGKTNILDAIHYTCIGKSFFTAMDKHIVSHGSNFFRIEAGTSSDRGPEVVVIKSQINTRKEIEISGNKLPKLSDHIGQYLCVMIAPSDIHAILDTSEERRNFINNTISQTSRSYLDDLIVYNKCLKQRNAVIKSFGDKHHIDSVLLDSVTQGLYEPAQRIHHARISIMEQMNAIFPKVYAQLSGESEDCHIVYQSDLDNADLKVLFAKNLNRDIALGRTTNGIHKDDLVFYMNGEPLKNFASQGQLKSFVLSLKLTQYHLLHDITGHKPVLLLDDIFDKLDQYRVTHLLHILNENPFGQVFITDTDHDRIVNVLSQTTTNHRIFAIESGKTSQAYGQNQRSHHQRRFE
jgi:DNA replication and repair protein RecF